MTCIKLVMAMFSILAPPDYYIIPIDFKNQLLFYNELTRKYKNENKKSNAQKNIKQIEIFDKTWYNFTETKNADRIT